jgi:hypothetical protein
MSRQRKSERFRVSRIFTAFREAARVRREWNIAGFAPVTMRKTIDNVYVVRGRAPIADFAKWLAVEAKREAAK